MRRNAIPKRLRKHAAGFQEVKLTVIQIKAKRSIEKSVTNKEYFEVVNHCFICGFTKFGRVLTEIDRYGFNYSVHVCSNCAHWQAQPTFRESDYEDFYKKYYREIYTSNFGIENFFKDQIFRGDRIRNWLNGKMELKNISIVDVGAGAGGILKAFEVDTHQLEGFDFDERYLDYGRSQKISLKTGGTSQVENASADLLILSHVLEHVLDLGKFLSEVKTKLKPGGKIYVEVPGIYSIWRDYGFDILQYFQNAHLHHFRKRTLVRLFLQNGFSPLVVDEKCRGLFQVEKSGEIHKAPKPTNTAFLRLYTGGMELLLPLVRTPYRILQNALLRGRDKKH